MFRCQSSDHTCSPVLLYNIGQWLGMPVRMSDCLRLCKTDENGTYDEDFEKALYNMWPNKLRIIKYENPFSKMTYAKFMKLFNQNNIAIALGHYEIWDPNGEMHHSLWLAPRLAINLKPNLVYCKDEEIYQVITQTPMRSSEPALCYILEQI